MSMDPSFVGPKGAPLAAARSVIAHSDDGGDTWQPGPGPAVTRAEVLTLQPGDRLVIHVDGASGMSGGGADQVGRKVRDALRIDELGFDVPTVVVAPGLRVEIVRPA